MAHELAARARAREDEILIANVPEELRNLMYSEYLPIP